MELEYLTPDEAANLPTVRKDPRTIRLWINRGYRGKRLTALKAGREWRININTLKKFMYEIGRLPI